MGTDLNNKVYNPGAGFKTGKRGLGVESHPITHVPTFHAGQDYQATDGTPIYAAADGVVLENGFQFNKSTKKGWGNYILLEHMRPDGVKFKTRYAHMQERSPLKVGGIVFGEKTIVGNVGRTGGVTGSHLHYEIITGPGKPSFDNTADPRNYKSYPVGGTEAEIRKNFPEIKNVKKNDVNSKKYTNKKKARTEQFNFIQQSLNFKGEKILGLSDAQTRALAADTMKTESSGIIDRTNEYGYLGLYQFGAEALVDIGLVDGKKLKKALNGENFDTWAHKGNQVKFLENDENWLLQGGRNAFLKNKELQDKSFSKYASLIINRGINKKAIKITDPAKKIAAYYKAAHLKGNSGANALFLRNESRVDANGTSTAKYAKDAEFAIDNLAPKVEKAMIQRSQQNANNPNSGEDGSPQKNNTVPSDEEDVIGNLIKELQKNGKIQPNSSENDDRSDLLSRKYTTANNSVAVERRDTDSPTEDPIRELINTINQLRGDLQGFAVASPQSIVVDIQNGNIVASVNDTNSRTGNRGPQS